MVVVESDDVSAVAVEREIVGRDGQEDLFCSWATRRAFETVFGDDEKNWASFLPAAALREAEEDERVRPLLGTAIGDEDGIEFDSG
jgi:hypothetical protein